MNEGCRIRFDRNGEIWLVSKKFMSGAFGEVFRLVNKNNETRVMKMEARISPEEAQHHICRLKVESLVLKSMNEVEGFPKLFHCGRTKSHNYIVMEHLGPDLSRIRRSLPRKRFTIHTAMRISADVLKRLEALHLSGWIYRDVKPQNFAIGIGEKSSTVYILDFGMTRRAREKERRAAPVAGTFRYISLRTNSYKEQSYRDDLESWIYMTIELVAGKLPWSSCATIELYPLITDMKNYGRHRAGRKELFAAFPSQFEEIFDIILKLG
uniref:Protein kinase domain-containing protein n=1 Tax=Acrobeloides nanus TaxID=290746 RepID=A0A914EDR4_9BILA